MKSLESWRASRQQQQQQRQRQREKEKKEEEDGEQEEAVAARVVRTRARAFEHKYSAKCRFCGGARCLRCSEGAALRHKGAAFRGLHCDWITDSILATQRPSTRLLEKYDLINKFKSAGIRQVVNLTQPGEHPWCGDGLDKTSGFPYRPEDFMAAGIGVCNIAWEDMTTPALHVLCDIVRVMAACEGKIAVHCHAGYGRTGLVIACYLIFQDGFTSVDAINLVRRKRPGSIQTPAQQEIIRAYELFLLDSRIMYHFSEENRIILGQHLANQAISLPPECEKKWGKVTRWVPLPVHLTCLMLESLAQSASAGRDSVLDALGEGEQANHNLEIVTAIKALQYSSNLQKWGPWMDALQACESSSASESKTLDPRVPACLLQSWLLQLKSPVLSCFESTISRGSSAHEIIDELSKLPVGEVRTLARIVDMLRNLLLASKKPQSQKDTPSRDLLYISACRVLSSALVGASGCLPSGNCLMEILTVKWEVPKYCRPYSSIQSKVHALYGMSAYERMRQPRRLSLVDSSKLDQHLINISKTSEILPTLDDLQVQ